MNLKPYTYRKIATMASIATALAASIQAQTVTNPVPNQIISWNFDVNGTVNPTDLAGLAPTTNWNNSYPNNPLFNLPDNTGTATTVGFDASVNNTSASPYGYGASGYAYSIFNHHPGYDANGTADKEMLNGYLNGGPAAWGPPITNSFFAVTNIPYAVYDVVVYFSSDTSGRHASIDNGSTTNYFSTMGSAEINGANALFIPATQTNSASFSSADFVFFPGMTSSHATITEYPLSGNDQWLGIAAFQVIQASNTYVLYGPSPSSQIVPVGQPASFSVMAGGLNPRYQWQHAGTNILNATNAVYTIAAATIGQDGNYDVVVSNSFNSVTSVVATLTFYTPKTVEWDGNGTTWDTTSLFWTVNGGASATNYTETDNTLFDPLGAAQSTVTLAGTFTPSSVTVSNSAYTLTGGGLDGSSSLHVKNNGTLILDTPDTSTGPTTIDNGSTLQLDNGDTAGSLGSGPLTNNGALLFNANGSEAYGYPIYGSGNVTNLGSAGTITLGNNVNANHLVQAGTGILLLQGSNSLSGGLVVSSGTVWARSLGALGDGPVAVNAGELQLIYAFDFVAPSMTLSGGLLHSVGGNNIFEGAVTLTTDSSIQVDSMLTLANATGLNGGNFNLTQTGGGALVLAGANNNWASVTIDGTLQVGNGGANASLGSGTITDSGTLAFDSTAGLVVTNLITGAGGINQLGSGSVTFTGDLSTLTGTTTVSAGTLGGNTTNGCAVNVLPGATLAPGTPSAIGTMTINGGLTLGGNVLVKVNKALVQSNDVMAVPGGVNNTNNGAVIVKNLGSALQAGDTFTLFSQPVTGGNTMAVVGGGVIWTNNLALNGSISVLSTTVSHPVIRNISTSAGNLVFSGSSGYPNAPYAVLSSTDLASSNWTVVATGYFDGTGAFSVTNAIAPGAPRLFYRLEQ